MHVAVRFLGNPRIHIDHKELFISKNKLRLLLLYLLYKENCTRDELMDLFWEEDSADKGRANLRNTLYELKKLLPEGLIKIEGHHYVGIYKNVVLEKDIDVFLCGNNENQLFDLKDCLFMETIVAKNNNNYNEWVQTTRAAYSSILLSSLESQLNRSILNKNNPRIREISNRILDIEPIHEQAYRELIKLAIQNHSYNVGWKLIRQITALLKEELGAMPEEETLRLVQVLKNKESQSQEEREGYLERLDLMEELKKQYRCFKEGKAFQSMVVRGELGTGKSYILSSFLKEVDVAVHLFLGPNDNKTQGRGMELLLRHDDFLQIDNRLGMKNKEKTLLRIENLQYLDETSAQEILHNLRVDHPQNLMIVGEYNDSKSSSKELENFLETEPMKILTIPLLSLEQMADYIRHLGRQHDPLSFAALCEKTRGNMLMLHHELEHTTPRAELEGVYCHLDMDQRQITTKLALFQGAADPQMLEKITDFTRDKNLQLLDLLMKKGIVAYKNKEGFSFKYQGYKELALSKIETAIATEYHRLIAQHLEEKEENFCHLTEALYQYQQGLEETKALQTEVKLLRIKLDFIDQLFPVLKSPKELKAITVLDKFDVYQELQRLQNQLQQHKNQMEYEEYAALEMELLFLQGRTMIAGGRGKEGMDYIHQLIAKADKAKRHDYVIRGRIEQIHYGIHKEDYPLMAEGIGFGKAAIAKAQEENGGSPIQEEERYLAQAEITRLEGLYNLRIGNIQQSKVLLLESIASYDLPRYGAHSIIPIAAATHYMGELYEALGQYETSKGYYQQSVEIIEKNQLTKSLDIFYADWGHLLYQLGEKEEAKDKLNQSLSYYEQTGNHWKRTLVESLLGLLALEENKREAAIAHMRSGEIFYQKDRRKLEGDYLEELKTSLKNLSISKK